MKTMSRQKSINKRSKSKRVWISIVIVLLVAVGAAGYFYWSQQSTTTAEAAEETYNTSQVRQGSIMISVNGSGTLTAGQERDLAFSASGTVAELNVEVGDVVEKDQVLAVLDNLTDLQAEVNTAQRDVISAQLDLDTLKGNAAANLANAQLDLIDAKEAVADAQAGVVQKGWARCDQETTDAYYYQYMHALDQLEALGDGGGHEDYYLTTILPAKNVVARARASYEYCAGFTDNEIASSTATLSLAQANLKVAEDKLSSLTENQGIDPIELATAENKVANAQLAVDQAKKKLEGATLKAPFDGTILAVEGSLGDEVGTGTFITIADLAHPLVEFSVDETDMDKVYVGEPATITFDAVPDRTFNGSVIRINPSLQSSMGYSLLTGIIELDISQETDLPVLPKGLNASVELIQASAENVLLVPVQALRDLGDGTYAVFVVGADGQPKLRVVEVGIQDAASAEIKSGVALGDTITTGTVETKQ